MGQTGTQAHPVNSWSEPVNGLSGRVRVEFEDLKPGLRHAIYLELRNHSFNPIAVTNQPQIRAELANSGGKPVPTAAISSGGPIHPPQWGVIPSDAYIGFRIDMQTVGVPTREQGAALLATGGRAWRLGAGRFVLTISLVFNGTTGGPTNQWAGELSLPPVDIVVTPEMLARA